MTNTTQTPRFITFSLTATAAGALALDDITMYTEGTWSTRIVGKLWEVTATRATAKLMLGDAQDRSTKAGEYDQPASWYRSCRIAADTIKMALAQ